MQIYGDETQIKAFSIGRSIATIILKQKKNKICLNGLCFSGANFNKTYLSRHYPPDTLHYIFKGEPIFARKNIQKIYKQQNSKKQLIGFNQKIGSIGYKVRQNLIYFKDSKRNILIRMQQL